MFQSVLSTHHGVRRAPSNEVATMLGIEFTCCHGLSDASARNATVHVVDRDAPFLSTASDFLLASGHVVKTFFSAAEFLEQFESDAGGCVVADLCMPGPDLQSMLALRGNSLPIVFLTDGGDVASIVRAMRGGAEDVLEKQAPLTYLREAVGRALARDANERSLRARQSELRARFDTISARELEVLSHVVQGRLNKQIADDLAIHERTVKMHRAAIMAKLGVRSVAALTLLTREAAPFAH
jgi:FixJ family two-component response regulator